MGTQNQYDRRYAPATPAGYEQVYYDPETGQFMRPNPEANKMNSGSKGRAFGRPTVPLYTSIGNGQTTYTPPAFDFNSLAKQAPQQAQAYVRPNLPTQDTGSGYRPQFDPTFIQQMLAQRFGNQLSQNQQGIPAMANPGMANPTITPMLPPAPVNAGLASLGQGGGQTIMIGD